MDQETFRAMREKCIQNHKQASDIGNHEDRHFGCVLGWVRVTTGL